MPNLVVYVPAALWKHITELNLDDPKVEARKVAIGALERYVMNGRLEERDASYSERPNEQSGGDRSLAGRDEKARPSGVQISSAPRSSSCPMNTPKGTKCKACGKVHS